MNLRSLLFHDSAENVDPDVPAPPPEDKFRVMSTPDILMMLEAGVGFLGADVSAYYRDTSNSDPLLELRMRLDIATALTDELVRRHNV